jgi:hypothetical protein
MVRLAGLDLGRYGNGPAAVLGAGGRFVSGECEMNPIALRDLAILLTLAFLLVCVLLALRATQSPERRRRH